MSFGGDANIGNQIATAGRVRQVVDDLDISALQTRARGNPLCLNLVRDVETRQLRAVTAQCLNLVPGGPEERTELGNHPIVRFGST